MIPLSITDYNKMRRLVRTYAIRGPPSDKSKTCLGLSSQKNLCRSLAPWFPPLFGLMKTSSGLACCDGIGLTMKILRADDVGGVDGEMCSTQPPTGIVPLPSPLVALPLLPPLSRFFTDAFRRRRIDDLNEPWKTENVTSNFRIN